MKTKIAKFDTEKQVKQFIETIEKLGRTVLSKGFDIKNDIWFVKYQ